MKELDALIIIPARFGSSRFPGKPLEKIAGKTLLQRVVKLGEAALNKESVVVATDDERIAAEAKRIDCKVVMTPIECRNGSERVHAALEKLKLSPKVVVNLQGDSPLLPPFVIQDIIKTMLRDRSISIATPAVRLEKAAYEQFLSEKKQGRTTGTTVTFDLKGDALYFSKSIIPFVRTKPKSEIPVYQHIGLYAYTPQSLANYISLTPGLLEEVEQLEQLRALEHGVPIRVVPVDLKKRTLWSVDTPEDVKIVEEIIKREGEIL